MGCGAGVRDLKEAEAVDPKQEHQEESLIWIKLTEAAQCSKCSKYFQFLFSYTNKHSYICCQCCPQVGNYNKCPNKHKLTWMGFDERKECSICSEHYKRFFACNMCEYRVCTKRCKPPIGYIKKLRCPNLHTLIWKKNDTNHTCEVCGRIGGAGYLCEVDGYFVCSEYCKKVKNAITCPNKHQLQDSILLHYKKCELCKQKDNKVFKCKECDFIVCYYCRKENKLDISNDNLSFRSIVKHSLENRLSEKNGIMKYNSLIKNNKINQVKEVCKKKNRYNTPNKKYKSTASAKKNEVCFIKAKSRNSLKPTKHLLVNTPSAMNNRGIQNESRMRALKVSTISQSITRKYIARSPNRSFEKSNDRLFYKRTPTNNKLKKRFAHNDLSTVKSKNKKQLVVRTGLSGYDNNSIMQNIPMTTSKVKLKEIKSILNDLLKKNEIMQVVMESVIKRNGSVERGRNLHKINSYATAKSKMKHARLKS